MGLEELIIREESKGGKRRPKKINANANSIQFCLRRLFALNSLHCSLTSCVLPVERVCRRSKSSKELAVGRLAWYGVEGKSFKSLIQTEEEEDGLHSSSESFRLFLTSF